VNEYELADEAAQAATVIVERIHASGKVLYDVANDEYRISPEVLRHAIACAMLTWEHRHLIGTI
jgi:hypothetical protein